MIESVRILIEEASQTADARRTARKIAEKIGFDTNRAEEVAIVVTEACTNLLKHAGRGEVLLCTAGAEDYENHKGLEVLAIDKGPGMEDLSRCLRDGYSTGGSPGQGMGAIMRLSNDSDFYTNPAKGTVVLARWFGIRNGAVSRQSHDRLQIGAVNVCKPGQEVCGDSWGVITAEDHTVFVVADGLGHGYEAKAASAEAVRVLYRYPDFTPKALLERVHNALASTRGAAVAVARIDHEHHRLAFSGAGNIAAIIYAGSKPTQHLVSLNGTAGHQIHRIQEFSYAWPRDGMLILHSDGLSTGTSIEAHPGLALRDPTLIAGVLYRDFTRGHDDSTVVVAKAA